MLTHFIAAIKRAREQVAQSPDDTERLTPKKLAIHWKQAQLKPQTPDRRFEDAGTHKGQNRLLAYRKWQEAGCPAGDGVEFWLAAEKEILRDRLF